LLKTWLFTMHHLRTTCHPWHPSQTGVVVPVLVLFQTANVAAAAFVSVRCVHHCSLLYNTTSTMEKGAGWCERPNKCKMQHATAEANPLQQCWPGSS
jgi:hypothetical protein